MQDYDNKMIKNKGNRKSLAAYKNHSDIEAT